MSGCWAVFLLLQLLCLYRWIQINLAWLKLFHQPKIAYWENIPIYMEQKTPPVATEFSTVTSTTYMPKTSAVWKGYCTGMVDANEDSNTPHDTWPFLLATTLLAKNVVEIRIQQTNNGCTTTSHNQAYRTLSIPQRYLSFDQLAATDMHTHNTVTSTLFQLQKVNKPMAGT